MSDDLYVRAAELISQTSSLVITAGAGMGVDSGLPDFRGDQGFWNAYPMYERLGLSFVQAANPEHFDRDPHFGWGFYGHRTNLYRKTIPHSGFRLLQDWISRYQLESFVVTSNVDGQFQKAGFSENRVLEVHGSIHHLQCTVPCCQDIWPNQAEFLIDESTMRAANVPHCPHCHRVARPNILMFGDYSWLYQRTAAQERNFSQFLNQTQGKPMVIVEMGAGTSIPTIRNLSEQLGQKSELNRVIRINPREPQIRAPHLAFAGGTLDILSQINDSMQPT